ncbi:SCO family protein [Aurantibacillus circumpalustris]|uniref:SCO family protein n=1 Tax=Aurantibacillus circumpalustris TaxID=3036359 RepID=UPI00295B786A|nr:SCO family protein [Aurantibacillus circumpalustris]
MNFKFNYYWLLLLIPASFVVWNFIPNKQKAPTHYLAYFGPKDASKVNDTTYHFIPDFEFVDQDNEKVNLETIKNKIYVAEYFFTTCKSICPIMNSNLDKVYKEFKDNKDFLILSHTVDPETDSVPVLKEYSLAHSVTDKRWLFVTGSKPKLYELARKGYLLNAEEGNGGEEDFIHTQNFALIDKEQHIRGFYDGTDSIEVNRLIQEIKLLIKEYDYKKTASL